MAHSIGERFFDFFGLAPEMRDEIYDSILAVEPDIYLGKGPGLHTRVKHAMTVRLSLVCRQFRQECSERAQLKTRLVLKDVEDWVFQHALELPAATSFIRNLDFFLVNTALDIEHSSPDDACGSLGEYDFHYRWIADVVAKQQRVRSITVQIYVRYAEPGEENLDAFLDHGAALTTLENLTHLVVYRFTGDDHDTFDLDQPKKLVLTWSLGDGEMKRVEGSKAVDVIAENESDSAAQG
ncbi:hypothetical protein LTR36_003300 [Oleoguttula mirabilis]|uniref:Uncharacterized protein n=1 Tax=Oleoguttula mirabilis TaxID=1507867 RepID=A0AAV9JXH0_9PEZI|nr:hypothetical protein LTR36_003300 [Oleoguttula mirabilis]